MHMGKVAQRLLGRWHNHQPKLHGGLVIKHNANQRYATNAVTAFIFREIAERHQLPIQVSTYKKEEPLLQLWISLP